MRIALMTNSLSVNQPSLGISSGTAEEKLNFFRVQTLGVGEVGELFWNLCFRKGWSTKLGLIL